MFWKKKTNDKELIEYEPDTRREGFRLQSEAMGPTVATYNNNLVEIVDISSGGISFEKKGCRLRESGNIQIELPGQTIQSITLSVEILRISEESICHCRFTSIDAGAEEIIHQYILFRQIAFQRKRKASKEKAD